MPEYRGALQRTTDRAAVPYAFTALNAAAAGVLIETHGPPSSGAALLFLCGAIAGFTLAALPGRGALEAPPLDGARLGLCSAAGALVAFGCATLAAHAIDSELAFGVVGLLVTIVYLYTGAFGAALLGQHEEQLTGADVG